MLSQARLTITSSLLDAVPQESRPCRICPLVPMFLALALFGFFLALVYQLLVDLPGGSDGHVSSGLLWLWPRPIKGEL